MTIKASCPICGEVDLGPSEIELRITHDWAMAPSTYAFRCPTCLDHVEKVANERIIRLLLSGSVIPLPLNPHPEEIPDPSAPAFTLDDVLTFHEELERTDRRVSDGQA